MAVSMNAGSNMRADFMISDAALPQRIEEIAEEQAGMFAQLLSDIGDAKGDLAVEVNEVVQKYSDLKDSVEASIYRDKETGMPLPEDPKKLAALILKGTVKLKNVPAELITPELMMMLMLMRKSEEFGKDDEDDEDSIFDPTEAIAAEQKFQQEISNAMLMELYQILEKHNERESEDKVTMLDGISEPIDTSETFPSIAAQEQETAVGEDTFTQLIDNLVETVSEELEAKADAEVQDNVDVFVPGERIEAVTETQNAQTAVIPDQNTVIREAAAAPETAVPETVTAPEVVDVPKVNVEAVSDVIAEQTVVVTEPKQSEVRETVSVYGTTEVRADSTHVQTELPKTETVQEVPLAAELQPEKTVAEQTVSEKAIPAEQITVTRSEQSAEVTAEQTVPDTRTEVKPAKQPETVQNTVLKTETDQPAVKVVTRNENAEQIDTKPQEAPKELPDNTDLRASRVKSATEELEMLRNAKAKLTGKPVEEKIEFKSGVKPEQTAQPVRTDSPIVLRKADGSEIEVRPSEIIRQAVKLVEKAVAENDDKSEYSLVLNPEEFGKITVKLTKAADGAISVTIAAENARTQRILEQNSDLMQNNLRSNGVNLESWQTVGERQQETLAQDYNGSSKNPYFRNDNDQGGEDTDGESFADIIASM